MEARPQVVALTAVLSLAANRHREHEDTERWIRHATTVSVAGARRLEHRDRFARYHARVLADRLERAAAVILGRLPAPTSAAAAPLLAALVRALRAGAPAMRPAGADLGPATAAALQSLQESVATALDTCVPAPTAREVWAVADWFAAAAAQHVRDDNRRLMTMLDALPDHLMLLDRGSRIMFVNRSAAALASAVVGRPREELAGMSVLDGQQPDTFKQYALDIVARACRGETFVEEFVLPGPDGPQWRESHIAPVHADTGEVEAVAVASRDIHARKQAEARLQLLSKIGALVGTDSAAVLSRVAAATVPELADVTFVEGHESGAAPVSVATQHPEHARRLAAQLAAGTSITALLTELGARSTIEVPVVVLGATVAIATFAYTGESGRRHDAMDREIAQEAARRVAQIVENARLHEELAESLVFRERVMGILGHDLRNPLAAVLSLSALLAQRADVPERTKEGLGHIKRAADRMEQMIHTILDFTQLRFRGAPPLSREPFELDRLARSIVEELLATHPTRHIAVTAQGDLRGRWDYTRMGQVIANLVGNALAHGARDAPVLVDVSADADHVALAVTNRGPAIPPTALTRLFEPFWQASADSQRRGLGLGLFIAQQIVHAHDGTLEVRSHADATTFTVRLRREPA